MWKKELVKEKRFKNSNCSVSVLCSVIERMAIHDAIFHFTLFAAEIERLNCNLELFSLKTIAKIKKQTILTLAHQAKRYPPIAYLS